MNKVILMGNLGGTPELRRFATGSKLSMRLATTERYRDKDNPGQYKETTQWHNVSIWGPRAEGLERILNVGDRIVVEGRLESHEYEDKQGNRRIFTEVKARDVLLAGGPRRDRTTRPGLDDSSFPVPSRLPPDAVRLEATL
ncbi:MAG: single-stranded DNA-binding protein [Myxococcota bacterium]